MDITQLLIFLKGTDDNICVTEELTYMRLLNFPSINAYKLILSINSLFIILRGFSKDFGV